MKRTSAPSEINIGGSIFKMTVGKDNKDIIREANAKGLRYRTVNVISSNLLHKTDLHGNPYKPSVFIYVEADRKLFHYICKVQDCLNKYEEIASTYCDEKTPKKAEAYFRKDPAIKKFLGIKRYQIVFRQNSITIQ